MLKTRMALLFRLLLSLAVLGGVWAPGLMQPSPAYAHTVGIAWRVESNSDVTWFAANYHLGSPVSGGIIIDGTTYPFTSVVDPLPGDITGSTGLFGGNTEAGVQWQVVTVSGVGPGPHTVSTTGALTEAPYPDSFPVTVTLTQAEVKVPATWVIFRAVIDDNGNGQVDHGEVEVGDVEVEAFTPSQLLGRKSTRTAESHPGSLADFGGLTFGEGYSYRFHAVQVPAGLKISPESEWITVPLTEERPIRTIYFLLSRV